MGTLAVDISGVRAGLLHQSGEGSHLELDERYLATASRPVLGQIFEDDPTRPHRTRQDVPRWFANLLPEGPLRHLIAERAGVNERRSWFLLSLLGDDLPGAVRIGGSDAHEIDEQPEAHEASAELPLRFSLAGVQLKFSALRDDRGLTIPAQGRGGDWIVKLPDERYDGVPENEHLMMHLATEAGLRRQQPPGRAQGDRSRPRPGGAVARNVGDDRQGA
ncbi:MAG: type II toxin-antitoxin system HipA family toxin [Solirubrobacteraceae bacterium]